MFLLKKLLRLLIMQSINSTETYAYGTSKNLVNEKGEIRCNNMILLTKNY